VHQLALHLDVEGLLLDRTALGDGNLFLVLLELTTRPLLLLEGGAGAKVKANGVSNVGLV
jgi:hypothetical protein